MSRVTAEASVKIALDVVCERCAHPYTFERSLKSGVSRGGFTNAVMQGATGESIDDTAVDSLAAKLKAIGEGKSTDAIDERCPNCRYLQSWMRAVRGWRWGCGSGIVFFIAVFVPLRMTCQDAGADWWIGLIGAGIGSLLLIAVVSAGARKLYDIIESRHGQFTPRPPNIRLVQ